MLPTAPRKTDEPTLVDEVVYARRGSIVPTGESFIVVYQSFYRVDQRVAATCIKEHILSDNDTTHPKGVRDAYFRVTQLL